MTVAAPGEYEGEKLEPLREPFEELLVTMVVTSTRISVESRLKTKSILLWVLTAKHRHCSSTTKILAALHIYPICSIIALCFM